jgi:protein-L-isoaspartate(D-aspartate) O-methyltransferase
VNQRIKSPACLEEFAMPIGRNPDGEPFAALRRAMVEEQMRARGIRSEQVLRAMLAVPRHLFVPEEHLDSAYADRPIEIGEGQTVAQPFMVAAMAEALELSGAERVLEVGTGSGYSAAVLSFLAAQVYTIEKYPSLAAEARRRLDGLSCRNVFVYAGDDSVGLQSAAPFDAISVAAAAPDVPAPLVDQLAESGRMVIPVGNSENQELLLVTKRGGKIDSRRLHYCRFVPLTGRHGFAG